MKTNRKYSRREVVRGVIDLLESGHSAKHVADVLAAYLFESRETRNVELYLRDIENEILERFGKATVHVASARPLSLETKRRIKALIKDSSGAKDAELVEVADSGLIGGLVITTADSELDGSVQNKLQQLRSI